MAKAGQATVPWADLEPNPNLVQWLKQKNINGTGKTALKVGCGLGDDVEELAGYGFSVTGFDISTTAVGWCMHRFPESHASYIRADLFDPPANWIRGFDFILESYTLQVLPPHLRLAAMAMGKIAEFVAPGGTLLAIARGREPDDNPGRMPWPLTKQELLKFEQSGLKLLAFEDFFDAEDPPVRRFMAEFQNPASRLYHNREDPGEG